MLYGAGKLALLLAAMYAVYRIGRYARDRFQERFAQPEHAEPRCRAASASGPGAAPQRGGAIVVRCRYRARTSTSFSSRSETKGITWLTALPSGRLPVLSMAANDAASG